MDRLGLMAGEEILHAQLGELRKRLEALRRERQHQLYAAENALKGAEHRAQWLQLRAKDLNLPLFPCLTPNTDACLWTRCPGS